VKWYKQIRPNLRDIGLTGFGAWIIWKQVYAPNPNGYLALVGLACMIPSGRAAIISILSEPGPSLPSSSSTSERSQPSSSSAGEGNSHEHP
jgi:hypothetical protein